MIMILIMIISIMIIVGGVLLSGLTALAFGVAGGWRLCFGASYSEDGMYIYIYIYIYIHICIYMYIIVLYICIHTATTTTIDLISVLLLLVLLLLVLIKWVVGSGCVALSGGPDAGAKHVIQ